MTQFAELFGCNSRTTLDFFFQHLENGAAELPVHRDETLYAASVLAHFAQTSSSSSTGMPTPSNLSRVFDTFVLSQVPIITDPEMMELAGSESLLLAGFFRDQMKHRHNVRWYDQLGKTFYAQASENYPSAKRSWLLRQMSDHFDLWTKICLGLSRTFRDQPYLIRPPKIPPPPAP